MRNEREAIVQRHFSELSAKYPGLVLAARDDFKWTVRGGVAFEATYEDITLEDSFEIELLIPESYPDTPPRAKETGGRIPGDFHHNPDESLCLGTPLEVRMKFAEDPTLLGFVTRQLIGFLYSFSYWKQYGKMPFGELAHGGKGILEYYVQLFRVNSGTIAVELLKIIAEKSYKGHLDCPCASDKRLRDCHGELLRKINAYQSQDEFLYDYLQCFSNLKESGQKLPKAPLSAESTRRLEKYVRTLDAKVRLRSANL